MFTSSTPLWVTQMAGGTCILASIVVFVTFEWRLKSLTDHDESTRLLTDEVLLDVGVAAPFLELNPNASHELVASYIINGEKDVVIEPEFDYLSKVAEGRIVNELGSDGATQFPVLYPILKVHVVNNSGRTILLNRLVLVVEESTLTESTFCIPADFSRPSRHVLILNEGAGEVGPCRLRYRLLPSSEKSDSFEELSYCASTEGFTRSWFADLTLGLADEGVDIEALEGLRSTDIRFSPTWQQLTPRWGWLNKGEYDHKVRQACGRFGEPWARVLASFEQVKEPQAAHPVRFETKINLLEDCGPPPFIVPPWPADVALDTGRSGYEAMVPLERVVKAGDVEEIVIQVSAPKPSTHRLSLRVNYNNTQQANSNHFGLRIFVPRSNYEGEQWTWMYV